MINAYYNEITFPGLGISLNPSRGITLGNLELRWYAIIIACGLILAVIYACRRSKQFGLTEDHILDGVLWITPFAILCARAYYCAFSWEHYADNPISCLYIWEGGLAIYGGVIGAVIGVFVLCKIKKVKAAALLDMLAIGFLIGQSIGRWGNFMNREAFGGEATHFLRMGLTDTFGNTIYVHPTFLYESLWNAVGFVLLHFLSKRRKYDGQTALQYVMWYGAGRAVIEGMRTDSLYIPGTELRVSQVLSLVALAVALIITVILHFRHHDPAKLFVNQVAAREAEALAAKEAAEAAQAAEAAEAAETAEVGEAAEEATEATEAEEATEAAEATEAGEAGFEEENSQEAQTEASGKKMSRFQKWLRS